MLRVPLGEGGIPSVGEGPGCWGGGRDSAGR